MLSSLKEKILSVSLFNTDEKITATEAKKTININAGASILQHFQNQWEELHEINEKNSAEAENVAKNIDQISETISLSKKNIELINHILVSSNLAVNISNCLSSIKQMHKTSESIENDLIKLENLIDEVNFEKKKIQDKHKLEQYKLRREESLQTVRQTLQNNHLKKVTEYETSRKVLLEERQKVFHDAFKSDLELYKSLGTIPEIDGVRKQNGALLEEIQLDFDQNELDQFFNESKSETAENEEVN